MDWNETVDYLLSISRGSKPLPVESFGRIGERAIETFERLEQSTSEGLDEAMRELATTGKLRTLSAEENTMFHFRLHWAADVAASINECSSGLFPTLRGKEQQILEWLLVEAWGFPGCARTALKFPQSHREEPRNDTGAERN